MKRLLTLIGSTALLGAAAVLTGTTGAAAHEHRAVGDYGFVVGFLGEPAYLNQPNGLDLRVYTVDPGVDLKTASGDERHGVTGLEETLKAEVSTGGTAPMELTLEPRFNDEGAYDGNFLPTAAGDYAFHITGTIKGTDVDETFTSSPETFSSIEDTTDLQYPVKIKNNQDLQTEIAAAGTSDSGDTNTVPIVIGIIGIVLGAAGLGAGGIALTRGRG